jgi:hypothetical protein
MARHLNLKGLPGYCRAKAGQMQQQNQGVRMISLGTKEKMSVSKATSTLINIILNMSPTDIIETLNELEERQRKAEMNDRVEVLFAVDNRFCRGLASTVNSRGLYIETHEKLSKGENITLSFENKKDSKQVKTSGKVIRVDKKGIEIEFSRQLETPS